MKINLAYTCSKTIYKYEVRTSLLMAKPWIDADDISIEVALFYQDRPVSVLLLLLFR